MSYKVKVVSEYVSFQGSQGIVIDPKVSFWNNKTVEQGTVELTHIKRFQAVSEHIINQHNGNLAPYNY